MSAPILTLTAAQQISRAAIWAYARWLAVCRCRAEVSGLEHLPRSGPVVLAARHYHHLYDATVLLTTVPRSLHFLVALDWVQTPRARFILEQACRLAVWPGLLRADRLVSLPDASPAVWKSHEIDLYMRHSIVESVNVLVAGRALVVFPEGSPAIDPERLHRPADSMLPFQRGFVTIARLATRITRQPIPVVPVGLAYQRQGKLWQARVQFGPPITVGPHASRGDIMRTVENEVRKLSGL